MSKKLRFEITNIKQFRAKLKAVDDQVRGTVLLTGAQAGAFAAIGFIKLNMDKVLARRSGNLIGSVTIDEKYSSAHRAWVTFGPHTVYAAIHEFGGIIRPTNGPYLVFEVDGQLIFTKVVQMPARPYLRPAMEDHQNDIIDTLKVGLVQGMEAVWRRP